MQYSPFALAGLQHFVILKVTGNIDNVVGYIRVLRRLPPSRPIAFNHFFVKTLLAQPLHAFVCRVNDFGELML